MRILFLHLKEPILWNIAPVEPPGFPGHGTPVPPKDGLSAVGAGVFLCPEEGGIRILS